MKKILLFLLVSSMSFSNIIGEHKQIMRFPDGNFHIIESDLERIRAEVALEYLDIWGHDFRDVPEDKKEEFYKLYQDLSNEEGPTELHLQIEERIVLMFYGNMDGGGFDVE